MKNDFSDLDWLAFRYIANELTADEHEAFELRLADDAAACEALARAVELTDTIHAAETLAPVASSPPAALWRARLSWLAAGATAAAVLIAVSIALPKYLASPEVAARVSTDLAVAWSKTLPVVPQGAMHLPLEVAGPPAPAVDDAAAAGESLTAEDLPPSWMLAAVRGLAEAKQNGDVDKDMDMEATSPFSAEPVEN